MSKESRRRQRAEAQATGTPTTQRPPTSGSTSPTGTARAGRRPVARPAPRQSGFARYRTVLFASVVVAAVALAGIGIFSAASTSAFECSNIWEPTATPAPGAGASPQPGYVQDDMGAGHVAVGTPITYTYCAPASGRHYNAAGSGPIQPRVYGPEDEVLPQGWLHNLEHGALVLLYTGESAGATTEGQAALQALYDRFPPSPVCGFQPGTSVGPLFARFDQMASPFAALVWGRVLPMDELDPEAVLAFDQTFGERTNPEDLCPDKRVSPPPSVSPSGSVAPSGSPSAAPSESTAPSASPDADPSASPS